MPPPAFGKGNAFRTTINDKFVELARKDAQRLAGLSAALDSEKERAIIDVVTCSALASDRKTTACKEVRKALTLTRRGVDPRTDKTVTDCMVCRGSGRPHTFLCLRTDGRRAEPEKSVALAVWREVDAFLVECRGQILEQVCCLP